MSYNVLYIAWAVMFALTAGLGFVPEPEGVSKFVFQVLAFAFFIPPWLILFQSRREEGQHHKKVVRNLCLASIGATLVLMVLNVMSVTWSEAVGNGLYAALTVVSAPMVCGQNYLYGLFMWGCLLMGAISKDKKHR